MAAPVNQTLPVISGLEEVGERLTTTNGTWTAGPHTFTYQWQRTDNGNWHDIPGAITDKYVIVAEDCEHQLRVGVTAINNTGPSAIAYSDPTGTIPEDWFVVEDGSGLPDAVSYCSIEAADLYHAKRNNLGWSALTHGGKKGALVRATDYLEQAYGQRWKGVKASETQALSWPRRGADSSGFSLPDDVIPTAVIHACAELALRAAGGELAPDIGRLTKREEIDVIKVEYMDNQPATTQYRAIDLMLAPLLRFVGNTFRKVERT